MLWHIRKWFLFLSPCLKPGGFFSDTNYGNLLRLLEDILVGALLWQDPPGVFNCQNCPHGASGSLSVTVQVFLLLPWLPLSGPESAPGSCDSWRLPVSLQSWGHWFACAPALLRTQEELLTFQSVQLLTCQDGEW